MNQNLEKEQGEKIFQTPRSFATELYVSRTKELQSRMLLHTTWLVFFAILLVFHHTNIVEKFCETITVVMLAIYISTYFFTKRRIRLQSIHDVEQEMSQMTPPNAEWMIHHAQDIKSNMTPNKTEKTSRNVTVIKYNKNKTVSKNEEIEKVVWRERKNSVNI